MPGGSAGLEALWAWGPCGPGGPAGLEALRAWGPCWPGGPAALEALRACHFHPSSQLLSLWVDQKVFSTPFPTFSFFCVFIPAKPTTLCNFILGQNV